MDPKFIKVPSACNNNEELLKVLRDEYQGEVHISVGMTNKLEEEKIISLFENNKSAKERFSNI